jgi:hypothetical protein
LDGSSLFGLGDSVLGLGTARENRVWHVDEAWPIFGGDRVQGLPRQLCVGGVSQEHFGLGMSEDVAERGRVQTGVERVQDGAGGVDAVHALDEG